MFAFGNRHVVALVFDPRRRAKIRRTLKLTSIFGGGGDVNGTDPFPPSVANPPGGQLY